MKPLILALLLLSCASPVAPTPDPKQSRSGTFIQPFPHLLDAWGEFKLYAPQDQTLEFRFLFSWDNSLGLYRDGVQQSVPDSWSWVKYEIFAFSEGKRLWTITVFPRNGEFTWVEYDMKSTSERVDLYWRVSSRWVGECEFRIAQIIGRNK